MTNTFEDNANFYSLLIKCIQFFLINQSFILEIFLLVLKYDIIFTYSLS